MDGLTYAHAMPVLLHAAAIHEHHQQLQIKDLGKNLT
jgi:hypothetical protein